MFKIPHCASNSRYLAIKYFRHLFLIFFPPFYLPDLWSPGSCFKGLFILVYSHRRFPFICIHLFKGLAVCLSCRSTLLATRHLFSVSQFLFLKTKLVLQLVSSPPGGSGATPTEVADLFRADTFPRKSPSTAAG